MIDIRQIRADPARVEAELRRRDPSLSLAEMLELDAQHRQTLAAEEQLRARQNAVGPEVAERKRRGESADDLIAEMASIKQQIQTLAERRRLLDAALEAALLELPNLPHESVPTSQDKHDNVVVRTFGAQPQFDFAPKHHVELAERLGILDFERGAKVAGTGWPCYRGLGARLEWALWQYLVDRAVADGYELVLPPLAVNPGVMTTAGVLPKFQEQVYHAERDDLYLIPTAEIVLTGLFGDEILPAEALPLRLAALTPCFRREAGAHGAEERGLIRVHQFYKVERYIICRPEDSYDELERLCAQAEAVLAGLGLHAVTTLLVTGDIAQQAAKTYDLEAWLPGQRAYYEVSSCSNCEAYQARRGKIRYRPEPGPDGKPARPEHVHTLNGSALATSRLFAAILEQGQQVDGSVVLPPALRGYLGGLERLG